MHRFIFPLFAVVLLALGACASEPVAPHFVELPVQALPAPPADQAQIVFLEPINAIQGMFPVGLFEMNGQARTHLATTGSHTKVALNFAPGHHLLMAAQPGIRAHFLDVNVEAGKRYYVLMRFIYGNGFQLRPLRADASSDYSVKNKDFPGWVAETRFVQKTAESDAYFAKYQDLLAKTQTTGWATWQSKNVQERAELTLNPADAVAN
jgi:hypothetical protein